jgi:ubiquinone/menaquinone biosynthesis C-methylase UbiE
MTSFKQFEQEAWEKKAHRYNDSWGSVTIQPIDRVLAYAGAGPGIKLLDVGCGPGHLVAAAAERGAAADGCDLSIEMVSIAKKNYPQLQFKKSDADRLDFPDGSYDAIVLNYLLLHVADQHLTILESKRVLKPGGQLVFTLWLSPAASPGLKLMFDAVKAHADMSVIPPAQDIFMLTNTEATKSFLEGNGFTNVQFEEYPTGWRVANAEKFFDAVQAGTRIGGLIDLQKAEIKAKIKSQVISGISQFQTDEGYFIPMPSLITAADKR